MDEKTARLCDEWAEVLQRLYELASKIATPPTSDKQSVQLSDLALSAAVITVAARQEVKIING